MNPTQQLSVTLLVALTALPFAPSAAAMTTDPVGYVSVDVRSGSDNHLSIPFSRPIALSAEIKSINDNVVTFATSPNGSAWADDQYVYGASANPVMTDTYMILIETGAKKGLRAEVIDSGDHTVTVHLTDEDLSGITSLSDDPAPATVDRVSLVPYWSLETAFGEMNLPTFAQVYTYDKNSVSINKSANTVFTHIKGAGWINSSGSSSDDEILYQDEGFLLRLPESAVDETPLEKLHFSGTVPMVASRTIIYTDNESANDVRLAVTSPAGILLSESNLGASNFDQVYIYNNSSKQINKSASKVYTYLNGLGWIDSSGNDSGSVIIETGSTFLLRKPATENADFKVWTYEPSYIAQLSDEN